MWAWKELQCDSFSFETAYSREAKKRKRKGEIWPWAELSGKPHLREWNGNALPDSNQEGTSNLNQEVHS